ncbi:MAG: Trk system potassium transporter TrkA [Alphaproteobacteria bacterium]|nr:Trk system potassium transporter TrkA [Alphaproteobacteria bacterium]MCB9928269.1 Trk system potassium transporter TrkA [Alphaproteobacteria bacterium]
MKVIVCGAGQVGTTLARHLSSEENDVVVIDQSPELIRRLDDSLDVRGIVGYASRPGVLEQAGAADADMIIAATVSDEVNMMACMVGHTLFHIPTKIARVRDQEYSSERWAKLFGEEGLPINVIISPEQEVARAIMRRLHAPGAIEMIELADNAVRLIGVRLGEDCPIINTPLRQLTALFPDLNIQAVGVVREGRGFVPSDQDQLFPRDELYFVADTLHVPRAMAAVGLEEPESHRVLIIGGGNIGQRLARIIEEEDRDISALLIELDPARAQTAAQRLPRTTVLNGDAMDPDLLEEANAKRADTIIAVTDHDETNILSALLAKRFGTNQAIALVTRPAYSALLQPLDIDVVINPRAITASIILQHVRRGRVRAVHSIGDQFGEIIDIEAMESSGIVGKPLSDSKLPHGAMVGAVVREGKVIIPRPDTIIRAGDRVILFAVESVIKRVERIFAVSIEHF